MNSRTAYAALRKLGVPVVRTSDAAAAWQQSTAAASKMLRQLARAELIHAVRHGLWWLDATVDPFRLPQHLTAPFESYLSLQTALQLHAMIEQIPEIVYAISLGRTQRIATKVGAFSFHHVAPEVFGGYVESASGVRLATPEKALFDYAYLSAGRSRKFRSLPELELPHKFRHAELERWLRRIDSARSHTITRQKLDVLLQRAA